MEGKLVSIIIPLFNNEEHLDATILSALGQTYTNKEIIVVDNGSTDRSASIARKYEDEFFRVIQEQKKGASAARNAGIQIAKGHYIQFLDADDLLSPDKIASQVRILENNPRKIAVCSTVHFNSGQDHHMFTPSDYEEKFLIDADPVTFSINLWGGGGTTGSMVQPNAWLVPAPIIKLAGGWNETLSLDDDGEYFCRVLLQSEGVIKTSGLNYYRKSSLKSNLSAQATKEAILSQFRSLQLKFRHIAEFSDSEELKIAYLKSLYNLRFKIYPLYPEIGIEITRAIRSLNFDFAYQVQFPSREGNLLRKLIGWRLTKRLQYLKNKKKSQK